MTADDIWHDLADYLVKRRHQLGVKTQVDLAEAANVSLSTVARIESGRPMQRRSRTWSQIEQALQLEPGFIERYTAGYNRRSGYLIETSDVRDIEPRARALVKDALMKALPDVTVSRVLAAEGLIIESLQKAGFLPEGD